MLNKEIHKEQVQSLKFKLQSGYENLTSAFGMQGHPELDSGSDAWGLEPEVCNYLSPQKPFAYETCLTRMKNEKLKMKNVENCQSSNSNLQYNGCCTENRLKFLNTNISISINFLHLFEGEYPEYSGREGAIPSLYLNASTLIDLRFPDKQTQTERINFNKNRIDKQRIYKSCQSTNNKNKFCELNRENFAKSTKIFPLREGEMSAGQRGFMASADALFSKTEQY